MGDIFWKLLQMGITAGWLILAVVLLRVLLKKAPRWIHCLLWGMVAVRLVCPVSIESPVSVVPRTELVSSTAANYEGQQGIVPSGGDFIVVPGVREPSGSREQPGNPRGRGISLQAVLQAGSVVWLPGMLLLWIFALASRIRIRRMLREAVVWKDNVYICDGVGSPFILGILRPRVFMPSGLGQEQAAYILAHEAAHLKRKDHWWKPLGYLLLSVYWFQPLCWAAYLLFCRDIELACDERVIKELSFPERKAYSRVLLECGKQRKMILSCPLAFGEVKIRDRVKAVLNYKKPAFWLVGLALAACLIVAVLFLTNRKEEPKEEPYIVNTYQETPEEDVEECMDQGLACIYEKYYEMSDGTWRTDSHSYRYRLEVFGRLGNAAGDTTYIILSNRKDITFQEAWKASGLSSSMEDYFEPEEAVFVGFILSRPEEPAKDTGRPEAGREPEGRVLHEQPKPDQVCIQVQPSEYREQLSYYYIPEGEDQEWLLNRVKNLELTHLEDEGRGQGHRERGWALVYNDICLTALEGGYLYSTDMDEEGMYEIFEEDPKLCDYIQIMLLEELSYEPFEPSEIKDIVSAKLEAATINTDWEFYSQTITDPDSLKKLEEWFSQAEYMYGGADCGNQRACLELTLADGAVVKLSMASDSCANFGINGVYYDYRPEAGWYNVEFYHLFDEIPWKE